MLLLLTLACQSATPSWDLLTPTQVEAPAPAPAPKEENAVDPAFKEALDLAAKAEDPWGEDEQPATTPPAAAPAVEPEPVVEAAPPPAPAPSAPAGLPTQPAWGLRLVATVPYAQPPRAVVGLPSGEEVVVSPGSMLPQVGVVVVAVGSSGVQVARVTPAGDHANIETQNLVAQY